MFKELYYKIKRWIMSIYIGKDNEGSPIIHTTSNTVSSTTLKAGPVSTTTYHSDETLCLLETYTAYDISISYSYNTNSGYTMDALICRFSDEFYTKFEEYPTRKFYPILGGDSTNSLGLINPDDQYYKRPSALVDWWPTSANAHAKSPSIYPNDTSPLPSTSLKYARIHTNYKGTDVKMILSNFNDSGLIPGFAKTSSQISLDASDVTVGGVSLKDTRYLSSKVLNSVDKVITLNGNQFQLIGSDTSGISKVATVDGNKIVLKTSSGQTVFDSSSPGRLFYRGRDVIDMTVTTNWNSSGTSSKSGTIDYLQAGDLIMFTFPRSSSQPWLVSTYFLSYVEGYIFTLESDSTSSNKVQFSGGKVTFIGTRYSPYKGSTAAFQITYDVFSQESG